jgi:uncharacterized protein YkwD
VDFNDARSGTKTSSESGSDVEDDEEAFEKEALAAHNSYRAKHSVGPLVLDKQVIPIRENRPFELASNLIGN